MARGFVFAGCDPSAITGWLACMSSRVASRLPLRDPQRTRTDGCPRRLPRMTVPCIQGPSLLPFNCLTLMAFPSLRVTDHRNLKQQVRDEDGDGE
jgi:hypothetical protein